MRKRPIALLAAASIAALLTAGSFTAAGARPTASALRFKAFTLKAGGGEPNISISPDGKTILVDGLNGSPANFWRSTDGGKTFEQLLPQFQKTGGGDWDMRWLDNKTVVGVDLSLGEGIYVDRSEDGGKTWTQTVINSDVYDRPWLAVYKNNVYVVAKGFDGIPYCYVSTDGGKTFSPVGIPVYGTGTLPAEAGGEAPTPTEALITNQNAYVDHAMTDPKSGDLYVLFGIDAPESYSPPDKPVGGPNRMYVAHLVDGQGVQQFEVKPVHLGDANDNFIDGFNWLAIDTSHTLYVLGNGAHDGRHSTWLSFSKDGGKSWSKLVDVGIKGGTNVFGSIAAGSPGTLGLTYLHGDKDTPNVAQDWYVHMAMIKGANTEHPKVQDVQAVDKPVHTKDICMDGIVCGLPGFGDNRDLLDYLWNAIGPDGAFYAVTASDGPATEEGGVSVLLLKQIAGPGFGKGAPS